MSPHRHPAAPGTSPAVVRAGEADLDVLSQVIADAFHDLAPSRWLIPDPGARREIFPGYFRLYLEHALASGTVHTTRCSLLPLPAAYPASSAQPSPAPASRAA